MCLAGIPANSIHWLEVLYLRRVGLRSGCALALVIDESSKLSHPSLYSSLGSLPGWRLTDRPPKGLQRAIRSFRTREECSCISQRPLLCFTSVQNARALLDSERDNLLPWSDDELSQVFSPLQSAYQSFTNL